jgi:uncharacterized membrane protein YhdT
MITLFIFYIHTIAAVAAFTKRWQEADLKEGLLAVGLVVLIFSVGWSMAAVIVRPLIGERGFGVWLDRDTIALVVLTLAECVFYYFQLRRRRRKRLAHP